MLGKETQRKMGRKYVKKETRKTNKTKVVPSKSTETMDEGDSIVKVLKTKKSIVEQYSTTEELLRLDDTIPKTEQGRCSCLGISALTYPAMDNSMRSNMFTSHTNQFLALQHPEPAIMFTTAENVAGEHSDSYYRLKNDVEVYRKVVKFEGLVEHPQVYKLFVYDKKQKMFDVIERDPYVNLTENFGYDLNTDVMDAAEEGDKLKKGTVLYKSKSYDDSMNFGYGVNVTAAYTLDPFTSEDAAVVSETFYNSIMNSIETEQIDIKLNDNDYLLNLYGDDKNYKVIPDIGEYAKGNIIAAARRLFNNQVLYDFRKKNLSHVNSGDIKYFVDGQYEVMDITIYSNNEEIKENDFNAQINRYLIAQNAYYAELHRVCKEIMNSGERYSRDIDYLYKRSKEMIDTKKKWKENDSAFSNMLIRLSVRKLCHSSRGQKITPRFGNKSVIAQVRPDNQMPYTKDGRRVDCLLNLLAIINRTTGGPIAEQFLTSAAWKVRQKMATLPTLELKAELGFSFIRVMNETQYKKFYDIYQKLSPKKKEEFIKDMIEDGIYIHEKPMYAEIPMFYRLLDVLDKFDIGRDDLYVNKWGRRYKCLRKEFVGQLYILKLKQTDRRGYSSRNTGAIDITGLPTRRYKSRSHLEQTSSTAIRFGEYETLDTIRGVA